MPSQLSEIVARLRVCRDAGRAPSSELLGDILDFLEKQNDSALNRKKRDELIRRAALLFPAVSEYKQAENLVKEAKAMIRTWPILKIKPAPKEFNSARDYLHAAALHADLPQSHRQFYRVLTSANH